LCGATLLTAIWWFDYAFFVKSGKGLIPYVMIPVLAGYFLAIFQLIPLSPGVAKLIAPKQADIYSRFLSDDDTELEVVANESESAGKKKTTTPTTSGLIGKPRVSLEIDDTRRQAGLLVLALGCLLAGSYFFKTRNGVLALCWAMSLNGAAITVVGIVQFLSKTNKVLGFYELKFGGTPFGPFVNRNNAAGFLLICLGCCLGLIYILLHKRKTSRPKPIISSEMPAWRRFRIAASDFLEQLTIPKALAIVCAVCLCTGIIATASRGGTISMFVGAFASIFFFGLARRPKASLGIFTVVVLITIAASIYLGFGDRISKRFDEVASGNVTAQKRFQNWQQTLPAAKDFAGFGSGLGTYDQVHRLYRQDSEKRIFEHAENQYYETLIEAGWIGLSFLLAAILMTVFCISHLLRKGNSDTSLAAGLIGVFVLTGVATASFVDFGLYLPANMCAMAAVVGMICGNAHWHAQRLKIKTWLRYASPNWLTAVIGLVVFASSVYFALQFYQLARLEKLMSFQPLRQDFRTLTLEETDNEIALLEPLALKSPTAQVYRQLGELYEHRYRLLFMNDLTNGREFWKNDPDDEIAKRLWNETSLNRLHQWIYAARLDGNFRMEAIRRNSKIVTENLRPAREYFLRSRNRQPLLAETHVLLAQLQPITEDPEKDYIHIERSVALSPSNATLRFLAGKLHLQAGRVEDACGHLKKCLELDKSWFIKVTQLASAFMSREKVFLSIIPNDAGLLYRYAMKNLRLKRDQELRRQVLQSADAISNELLSTNFGSLKLSAEIKLELGNTEAAITEFDRAVRLRPKDHRLRYRLGILLLNAGKIDKAREQADFLVKQNPQNGRYRAFWKKTRAQDN
jgi:Flp pilus assembly protein TadD/O-antigen ligase